MGFLTRQLSADVPGYGTDPIHNFWYGPVGRRVASGVTVTHATAFNYSACWAATRLYTETIASLPRVLFRRQRGIKEHATAHPTYRAFKVEPNPEQSSNTFVSQQVGFCINWGNAYSEVERDQVGRVIRLWPIHPNRIPRQNIKRVNGELVYHVRNDDGTTTPIPRADIFHVPGIMSEDGITGRGVIENGAESIGMGLATEQHGASYFGNGASPSVVLKHPKHLTPEAAIRMRDNWRQRYSGPGSSHGVFVAEEGTEVMPLTFPPDQSQFLQTRQFNITEIARWYNLPPHLLRELTRSTNNNIESESLSLIVISLMPWLVKFETELDRQLLTESDQASGHFFKFQLQGLLRGDMAARSAFYREMFHIGVFSINDILELEDRNGIGPMGDLRFVPANMFTLESVFKKDTEPEEDEAEKSSASNDAQLPGATADGATGDVQQTALNGAQITALLNMGLQLALGELPPDGTHAMIEGSFPAMDLKLIDTIVTDFSKFAAERESEKEEEPEVPDPNQPPGQPPPPAPPGDGPPPFEQQSAGRDAMLTAAKALFLHQLSHQCRKFAKGAQWAAESGNFLSRLDEFCDRHRLTYRERIEGPLNALAALGVSCDPEVFAERHIADTQAALVELSGTVTADGLQAAVDAWSEEWLSACDTVVDLVMQGEFDARS